jgi:hypothetical protein
VDMAILLISTTAGIVPWRSRFISVLGDYAKNNDNSLK